MFDHIRGANLPRKLVSYPQLKDYGYNYSRGHLHKLEKAGLFPRHVNPSPARSAWFSDELEEHANQLKERRDEGRPDEAHARTEKARAARKGLIRKMPSRAKTERT